MSAKARSWAMEVRVGDPTAKLVLWALADRHNKDTGRCDPSIACLASDTELNERTVQRKLRYLEDEGLVSASLRKDERGLDLCSSYTLAIPERQSATLPRQPAALPRQRVQGGAAESPDRGGTVPPKPEVEPETKPVTPSVSPPSRRKRPLPDDWQPTPAHQAIATEQHVNLHHEADMFRDDALAKGKTFKDWDKAFNNWLRSPYAQRANGHNGNGHIRLTPAEQKRQRQDAELEAAFAEQRQMGMP